MEFIKGFFWDMPVDMWSDGAMGKFMALLWLVIIVIISGLMIGLTYAVIDSAFLKYQSGEAKIIAKRFDPAHDETYMQSVVIGKSTILIPQTSHYPDRYYLQMEIVGLMGEQQVEKSFYEGITEGKIVSVKYSKRRLSNTISFN